MNLYQLFNIFVIIVLGILIDYYIYSYLKEINEKKCECANIDENLRLQNYLLFSITNKILSFFYIIFAVRIRYFTNKTSILKTKPFLFILGFYSFFITIIYPILHSIYYYTLYNYVNLDKKCSCMDENKSKLIRFYVLFAVFFFMIQILVKGIFRISEFSKKTKKLKKIKK